jgi:hypothetical protein
MALPVGRTRIPTIHEITAGPSISHVVAERFPTSGRQHTDVRPPLSVDKNEPDTEFGNS